MQANQSTSNYFSSLRRQKLDTEFMPEVEGTVLEAPPWFSRITLWLVASCLLAAVVWAHFAVLQEGTTG